MLCTLSPSPPSPTLLSITPPLPPHYHPVGRLDQHSRGLLLFSSDSRLTSYLLSPTTHTPRVYNLILKGCIHDPPTLKSRVKQISEGIVTSTGTYSAEIIEAETHVGTYPHYECLENSRRTDSSVVDSETEKMSKVTVRVYEGKNRMLRRLFSHLGYFVVDLERVSYGEVELGDLKVGEYRGWRGEWAEKVIREWEGIKGSRDWGREDGGEEGRKKIKC
ncbi:hypothetical protein TrVE_jg9996 [Triparma verrucosa]|nr:hypothetical protein TrVE_jg9996 [Triparma verrucosa]